MSHKRLIYVDASIKKKRTTISLYDAKSDVKMVLQLKNVTNSTEAEKYAVLQAILYIIKHELKNSYILSDNKRVAEDEKINEICKNNGIGITWVPREINKIADRITKLEPTLHKDSWENLHLFYKLLFTTQEEHKS